MEFALAPDIAALRNRIRAFVEANILPLELDPANFDDHENIRLDLLDELRAKARAQGLWALQMPKERGGQGLPVAGMAACYEEMGRSIFGPVVFNSAAPDDGNMIALEKIGSEEQKARWLQPIVDGKVRSAFVMTEPAPGAGSSSGPRLPTPRGRARPSSAARRSPRRSRSGTVPSNSTLSTSASRGWTCPMPTAPARCPCGGCGS